jgi:hypothetical protein
MFHPDLHGGSYTPSRVVFSALAENGRLLRKTGSHVLRASHAAREGALRTHPVGIGKSLDL